MHGASATCQGSLEMPSYSVNQLFTSLADAGRELMRGRLGNRRRSPETLAEELLSTRGDASGAALARELLAAYRGQDREARRGFFTELATRHDVPREAVEAAIEAFRQTPDAASLKRLRHVLEPRRQELFRRLNMAPDGTRQLVAMRRDLLELLPDHPALRPVDDDLQELLAGWFNPGFLTFRPIDWNSPASLLEKLIRHERVHKIANLEALRRRLGPDRRCFAFFHPTLPDEPLIFVQVALVKGMADKVQPLLDQESPVLPVSEADTAIFYSISNCQVGLKGVSLGNFLIKMVVAALEAELPQLRGFATLSPIPGFICPTSALPNAPSVSSCRSPEGRGGFTRTAASWCRPISPRTRPSGTRSITTSTAFTGPSCPCAVSSPSRPLPVSFAWSCAGGPSGRSARQPPGLRTTAPREGLAMRCSARPNARSQPSTEISATRSSYERTRLERHTKSSQRSSLL